MILEGSRRYREAARSPDRANLRSWGLQEALDRQKQQPCAYNGQRSCSKFEFFGAGSSKMWLGSSQEALDLGSVSH